MDSLFYSNDALDTLHLFHNVDSMLYVEGDDDIVFWEYLIEIFGTNKYEITSVGGIEELKTYINKIRNNEIDAYAARDLDYTFLNPCQDHARIFTTYGYSIENTLLCENTLYKSFNSFARIKKNSALNTEISQWLNKFTESVHSLFLHDIFSQSSALGVKILGENCTRFMNTQVPFNTSPSKILTFLASIEFEVDEDFTETVHTAMVDNNLNTKDSTRGHFIFSAGLYFISRKIKLLQLNRSVSTDAFFSSIFLAFQQVFNQNHPHYEFYENSLTNL